MTSLNFILIIFSALCHAWYNLHIKMSQEKTTYMWSIFLVAIVIAWPLGWFLYGEVMISETKTVTYAVISAFFFTLYHIFAGKAYSSIEGDLSLAYPLASIAPIFICVWAFFLLDEPISLIAMAGIALTLVGAYGIQLNSGLKGFALEKFNFKNDVVRFALTASLFYSFGAISDKVGVTKGHFFAYTTYLMTFTCIYLFLASLKKQELRSKILENFSASPKLVLGGGIILFLSQNSYRIALEATKVSYASSIRQVASLFAVLFGIFLLRESYGRTRFISGALIVAGIVLIKFG